MLFSIMLSNMRDYCYRLNKCKYYTIYRYTSSIVISLLLNPALACINLEQFVSRCSLWVFIYNSSRGFRSYCAGPGT